jgi:phage-related protein
VNWTVDFYKSKSGNCPVKKYLSSLNAKQRSTVLEVIDYLETFGLELKEPFVKNLGEKVFELRAKDLSCCTVLQKKPKKHRERRSRLL